MARLTEVEFVASRIIEKIFQGDETRLGSATNIAHVAVKAVADYWENFSLDQEGGKDEDKGRAM